MIHATAGQVFWMLAFVTAHAVVAYSLLFVGGYFRRPDGGKEESP